MAVRVRFEGSDLPDTVATYRAVRRMSSTAGICATTGTTIAKESIAINRFMLEK